MAQPQAAPPSSPWAKKDEHHCSRALQGEAPGSPYQLLRGRQLEELLDEVNEALDGAGPLHCPLLGLHDGGVANSLQQDINWEQTWRLRSGILLPPCPPSPIATGTLCLLMIGVAARFFAPPPTGPCNSLSEILALMPSHLPNTQW